MALHGLEPVRVACDTHSGYYTSYMAARTGLPVARVPHHLAHILSGMIDNELEGPVLGIAWDGSGHGRDGTVWGGEFLAVRERHYRRFAHFLPFPLPGGETAVREPRRAAIGVLHAMFGADAFERTDLAPLAAFTPQARGILATMVQRGLNSPITSSVGRLFDAAASLLGLLQVASFEGEAAMAVEFAADRAYNAAVLPPPVLAAGGDGFVVDWRPLLSALVESTAGGMAPEPLAAGLHDALAQAIVAVAERGDIAQVLLTGGCFQNAHLTECAILRLRIAGFSPYWHHRIPPNDGGLAAGQILFAARPLLEERN
jgi:hydrogenase maturation protein HypF